MNTNSEIILNGFTREDLLLDITTIVRDAVSSLPKPEKIKPYLTLPEVCDLTGLSKATIYYYTFNRSIPFIKKSGKLLFNREEIKAWLQDSHQPVGSK